MGVGVPMNHMKPSKYSKNKTKRNLAVIQKSFPASSLVGKSSALATKDPQTMAAIGKSTSSATSISDINFSSSATLKAEIALVIKSVTSHISARAMKEFPQPMQFIFFDSEIGKEVHLQRTKLGYSVSHVLSPYYKEKN